MKRGKLGRYIGTNIRLVGGIIPVVLLMIVIFFTLTRNEILMLSKDRLALRSENCAKDISKWAGQVLNELDIYKSMAEQMGLDNDQVFEILKTTYDVHEAYPFGLYMGDEKGNYFDASGWVPGEDFVVTERIWYKEGLKHKKFTFGEPYVDAMTGTVCISATAKVDDKSTESVLAADVYWDYVTRLVEEVTQGSIENALFIAGKEKIIVVDSDTSMVGVSLEREDIPLLYKNLNQLLEAGKNGQYEINGGDGDYFVDISSIEGTNWYFIACMSRREMLSDLKRIEWIMMFVAFVAAILLSVITIRLSKEIKVIRKKAKTDPLTRLLNREGFGEMVSMALETHPNQGILLIIDLDNFKLINDKFGHPAGDEVLKKFAEMLEEFFNRNKDIVARVGGDEFAVFVGRESTREELEDLLNRFLEVVNASFQEQYPQEQLSASVGGKFAQEEEEEARYENLYQSADKALYQVKRNGKNGFKVL